MLSTRFAWAVLAALPFCARHANAELLKDKKLPDCISGEKFDTIQDMGKFWWESGAEQYADEYINLNGDHSNWTQDLYMEIFGSKHTDSKSPTCYMSTP
jgi:hypothetical protein